MKKEIKSNLLILKYKYEIKFPHNLRIISAPMATYHLAFIILLTLSITANGYFELTKANTPTDTIINGLLKNPDTMAYHEKLAETYLRTNIDYAEKEYKLADELYREGKQNGNILGLKSSPSEIWDSIAHQKENNMDSINRWKKVLEDHPDYRYAILAISASYYALGDRANAQAYLDKLFALNPADEQGLELRKDLLLKKNI